MDLGCRTFSGRIEQAVRGISPVKALSLEPVQRRCRDGRPAEGSISVGTLSACDAEPLVSLVP